MHKASLFFIIAILSATAHSAILDLGSITRDPTTGLDWLDITETRGLSYNEVTAQMRPDGPLEGWRYATMAELDQLIINFGYVAVNSHCQHTSRHCDSGMSGDSLLVEEMIKTLGDTWDAFLDEQYLSRDISPTGAGFVIGILGSQNIDNSGYDSAYLWDAEHIRRIEGTFWSDDPDSVWTAFRTFTGDMSTDDTGSFLVKNYVNPVPLPTTAWLFLTAICGLFSLKHRFRPLNPL